MNPTLLPLAAVVVGGVIYQLGMKSVPPGTNPFAVLAGAYALATAICCGATFVVDPAPKWTDVTNKPMVVVSLGLVLIEAGFLFGYRYGAKLGAFSFIGLALAAAVLLVAGYFFYSERLTWREWVGIGVCFVGLLLIKAGGPEEPGPN
jgi:drug/metabolite transporter (DMT)-like permease